jgi:hypothetical protein
MGGDRRSGDEESDDVVTVVIDDDAGRASTTAVGSCILISRDNGGRDVVDAKDDMGSDRGSGDVGDGHTRDGRPPAPGEGEDESRGGVAGDGDKALVFAGCSEADKSSSFLFFESGDEVDDDDVDKDDDDDDFDKVDVDDDVDKDDDT